MQKNSSAALIPDCFASDSKAVIAALKSGVDLWLLKDNLEMTYDERVQRHEDALSLVIELEKIKQGS